MVVCCVSMEEEQPDSEKPSVTSPLPTPTVTEHEDVKHEKLNLQSVKEG
jgi:hypothetical protein